MVGAYAGLGKVRRLVMLRLWLLNFANNLISIRFRKIKHYTHAHIVYTLSVCLIVFLKFCIILFCCSRSSVQLESWYLYWESKSSQCYFRLINKPLILCYARSGHRGLLDLRADIFSITTTATTTTTWMHRLTTLRDKLAGFKCPIEVLLLNAGCFFPSRQTPCVEKYTKMALLHTPVIN